MSQKLTDLQGLFIAEMKLAAGLRYVMLGLHGVTLHRCENLSVFSFASVHYRYQM
jgi:hypothetical protein